jgi:hypothetical protein
MPSTWRDAQYLDKPAFESLTPAEQKELYADANKWEYDYGTQRWLNVYHPDNEEWALMRQAAEARGYING